MSRYILVVLKIVYSLAEQFVFYLAVVIGFLVWIAFGNVYVSILAFILICIVFWMLPSVFAKKNKMKDDSNT